MFVSISVLIVRISPLGVSRLALCAFGVLFTIRILVVNGVLVASIAMLDSSALLRVRLICRLVILATRPS